MCNYIYLILGSQNHSFHFTLSHIYIHCFEYMCLQPGSITCLVLSFGLLYCCSFADLILLRCLINVYLSSSPAFSSENNYSIKYLIMLLGCCHVNLSNIFSHFMLIYLFSCFPVVCYQYKLLYLWEISCKSQKYVA